MYNQPKNGQMFRLFWENKMIDKLIGQWLMMLIL